MKKTDMKVGGKNKTHMGKAAGAGKKISGFGSKLGKGGAKVSIDGPHK